MKAYISRLFVGAAVFSVGAAFLLDTLHVIDTDHFFADYWPLFIILAGIIMLINDVKSYLWAGIVIAFGVITQLRTLEIIDINPWQIFWPLVLIIIGVSIAFKRPTSLKRNSTTTADDIVAVMGGSDHKSTAPDFTSSRLTAIMGGAKIDLRKAVIKTSATIEVFGLMGGIEIVVPRTVIIKNKTNVILGGVENKTDQEEAKNAPTLTIIGDVIMSGVEIKN